MAEPWPDDIRNWYAETLHWPPVVLTVTDAANQDSGALTPGRYMVYLAAVTGIVYFKQTTASDATDPDAGDHQLSTLVPGPLFFTVRAREQGSPREPYDRIIARAAAGGSGTVVIAKVSRDRS